MSARAAYPNAALFAIGCMTAAQAEHLCRSQGLALSKTERGNFALVTKPAAPRFPGLSGAGSSPVPLVADAAGHEPEAA